MLRSTKLLIGLLTLSLPFSITPRLSAVAGASAAPRYNIPKEYKKDYAELLEAVMGNKEFIEVDPVAKKQIQRTYATLKPLTKKNFTVELKTTTLGLKAKKMPLADLMKFVAALSILHARMTQETITQKNVSSFLGKVNLIYKNMMKMSSPSKELNRSFQTLVNDIAEPKGTIIAGFSKIGKKGTKIAATVATLQGFQTTGDLGTLYAIKPKKLNLVALQDLTNNFSKMHDQLNEKNTDQKKALVFLNKLKAIEQRAIVFMTEPSDSLEPSPTLKKLIDTLAELFAKIIASQSLMAKLAIGNKKMTALINLLAKFKVEAALKVFYSLKTKTSKDMNTKLDALLLVARRLLKDPTAKPPKAGDKPTLPTPTLLPKEAKKLRKAGLALLKPFEKMSLDKKLTKKYVTSLLELAKIPAIDKIEDKDKKKPLTTTVKRLGGTEQTLSISAAFIYLKKNDEPKQKLLKLHEIIDAASKNPSMFDDKDKAASKDGQTTLGHITSLLGDIDFAGRPGTPAAQAHLADALTEQYRDLLEKTDELFVENFPKLKKSKAYKKFALVRDEVLLSETYEVRVKFKSALKMKQKTLPEIQAKIKALRIPVGKLTASQGAPGPAPELPTSRKKKIKKKKTTKKKALT